MSVFDKEELKAAIRGSVSRIYNAQNAGLDLYRNTLDCFSAVIDSLAQGITLDDWMIQEKERQIQKTKQNAIGDIHEEIMGSIKGVDKLPNGNLIDIKSDSKKIVAEIKNKHNTTKGNHKVAIYDDLELALDRNPDYTAYYVEILPKGQASYNEPFTPSDNKTKTSRLENDRIRRVDGRTFYALLTGHDNAIDELYRILPIVVSEILNEDFSMELDPKIITESHSFYHNFNKAYGNHF